MVEDFELLSRGGEGRVTFWLQLGVCLSLFCVVLDLRGGVVERFRSADVNAADAAAASGYSVSSALVGGHLRR